MPGILLMTKMGIWNQLTINPNQIFLFHCFPLEDFSDKIDLINNYHTNTYVTTLKTIIKHNYDYRHNIDGFQTLTMGDGLLQSYTQLMRNGSLEFYTSLIFLQDQSLYKVYNIAGGRLAGAINECVDIAFNLYKQLEIEPIFYVKCTICNLQNSKLIDNNSYVEGYVIRREKIELPGILVTPENRSKSVTQVKDIIWQSSGRAKCTF